MTQNPLLHALFAIEEAKDICVELTQGNHQHAKELAFLLLDNGGLNTLIKTMRKDLSHDTT